MSAFLMVVSVCLLLALTAGCDRLPEEPWELVHVTMEGDTLWTLGAIYGVAPAAVSEFNDSIPNVFEAGTRVRVPYRVIDKDQMENAYHLDKFYTYNLYAGNAKAFVRGTHDTSAIIGDHDGDGNPSIIFSTVSSKEIGRGQFETSAAAYGMEMGEDQNPVKLGQSSIFPWNHQFTEAFDISLQMRNVDLDESLELIVIYRVRLKNNIISMQGGRGTITPRTEVAVVDLDTHDYYLLSPKSENETYWSFDTEPYIGDIDSDGSSEIVFRTILSKTTLLGKPRPSGPLRNNFTVYSTTSGPALNAPLTEMLQQGADRLLNAVRGPLPDGEHAAEVERLLKELDPESDAYLRQLFSRELEPFLTGKPWTDMLVIAGEPSTPANFSRCQFSDFYLEKPDNAVWIQQTWEIINPCIGGLHGRFNPDSLHMYYFSPGSFWSPLLTKYNGVKFRFAPAKSEWSLDVQINRENAPETGVLNGMTSKTALDFSNAVERKFPYSESSGNHERYDIDKLIVEGEAAGSTLRFTLGNSMDAVLSEERFIEVPRNLPLIVEVRHVMGFYQARVFAEGEPTPEWQLESYRPHYSETSYGGSLYINVEDDTAAMKTVEVYYDERLTERDRRGMHRALSRMMYPVLRSGSKPDAKKSALNGAVGWLPPSIRESALMSALGHMAFLDRENKALRPFGTLLEEYRAEKAKAGVGTSEVNTTVDLAVDLVDAQTGSLLSVDDDLNRFVKEVTTDVVYEAGRSARFEAPDNNSPDEEGKYWQQPTDLPVYLKLTDEEAKEVSDRFHEVRSQEIEFIKNVEAQANDIVSQLLR